DNDVLRNRIDQLPQFRFRLFAILNLRARREPTNNLSSFISQWLAANQKPAILSVLPPKSSLYFPTLAAAHRPVADRLHAIHVVSMKRRSLEIVGPKVVQPKTKEIEQAVIGVEGSSVGFVNAHILRQHVANSPELLLGQLPMFDLHYVRHGGSR